MINTRNSKRMHKKMMLKTTTKSWNVGKENKKIQIDYFLIMCLSLYDHQNKVSRYRKGLTNLKNRATTNQNQRLHSQKLKRKVLKHKINGKYPTKEKRKEKYRINQKTRFKMAINTYLSVITLNVKGLNAPVKRHRVPDWINKQKPEFPSWLSG